MLLKTLFQLMKADFLERTRRYSFFIILGLTIYCGYVFVPSSQANYTTLSVSSYRGFYNSAWIGCSVAMMTALFLSFAGFYLVKDTIRRDETTGVGQIIATTPLRKLVYILGKMLSNFAVLTIIIAVMIVIAGLMQIISGEVLHIDLWNLISPFIFLVLPPMLVVSSLALLFETIPGLRAGFGNVVYFALWVVLIIFEIPDFSSFSAVNHLFALNIPLNSIMKTAQATLTNYQNVYNFGLQFSHTTSPAFIWEGIQWTKELITGRVFWIIVPLLISILTAFLFHRFDPSYEKKSVKNKSLEPITNLQNDNRVAKPFNSIKLTTYKTSLFKLHPTKMLKNELRFMLKGLPWWWYGVAIGLVVLSLFLPFNTARNIILSLCWIWPLLIWSAMGTRELIYQTDQLVFSAPYPLTFQLLIRWLAGVLLTMLIGGGIGIRLLFACNFSSFLGWLVATIFISSLAFCLGVWSGNNKLFEVIYTVIWYLSTFSKVPSLDFMCKLDDSINSQRPLIYLALSIFLFGMTILGRKLKMNKR
ncbi:MAG: hypothetical protein KAX49_04320 [Halanaerobiales bacterium]|nr:hypothetical protein [Halanaerobiales bacterium]